MKIDWSKITTVLLDMDGTLLDLHFDNYFWLQHLPDIYSSKMQISRADAMQVLESLMRQHHATLNWYCVDFWSQKLNLDIMLHKAEVAHKISYRPQAECFLELCQSQVDDLRLITNGHREVLKLKIELTELDRYFDEMVCSHELGAPKEQQEFWHELQKLKAFDPDTTLFIDDSEAVLDTANDYGIRHIYSIAKPDSEKLRDQDSKYHMLESFLTGKESD
ncbi:MAG: GMP/IMP nucleotidase [Gammaproteobacteria bacterium]|nr:GMP/IMP nucleotidase [Gammaproteobacteria bacterium]